ncbi:MAG: tetratricopeptide repeat protein [Methanothrix sp.]|nr:tetratricopeptide repeat protein [Methanothrix sp.]
MFHRSLRICIAIFVLIEAGLAADIPFVFDLDSSGVAAYSPAQLEQARAASSDLRGVPVASTPANDDVLQFPVAGESSTPSGKTEKKAEEINKTLNSRVEPDNVRVHDLALALAAQHSGDYTIDQVCEIYSYLKYGNSTKKPWSYARDPRGVDYFNFASKSLTAGDDAKCAGAGDCDDFAILMSSLVESIGGTTRIILARNNSTGGHAYAEVYIGRLSDESGQVQETIKWLQQDYDTDKIFTHIDTDTKEVWLNLDWGNDAKGNAHPGGPFFQGDRHYILCIRDKYGKTAVNVPEKANKPPRLIALNADRSSPQEAGAVITWTADARDADGDPLLYRFFLNDDPATKWTEENRWAWTISEEDLGENQVEVRVRDGKHAGPDKYDANIQAGFVINAHQSMPSASTNKSSLAEEWNSRGDALHNRGNYAEGGEAWLNKGEILHDQGKYDEALKAYDEAIRLDPDYASAWNYKGETLDSQGKYDEALKAYDEAIRLDPDYALAWNNKGYALSELGKYDEAIKAYDEAIRLDPDYAFAWSNKGATLDSQGKYDEALKAYDEAIRLDPDYALAWNNKGYALSELGKYDEAIKACDEAIRLDPNLAAAWAIKGGALSDQGKYDEALKADNEAILLDADYALAWNNKGYVLSELGKYDEALKAYDEAIRLDPPNLAGTWNNKGWAFNSQGNYDEAIVALDEAIRLDPNLASAWEGKGNALKALGRATEADAAFARTQELEQRN